MPGCKKKLDIWNVFYSSLFLFVFETDRSLFWSSINKNTRPFADSDLIYLSVEQLLVFLFKLHILISSFV